MHYLIDGNNLIGHSRDLSLSHEDCRGEAMGRVAAYCRRSGGRATIFFDGGPDAHVGERGVSLGPVLALLAGKGVEADSRILRMIERAAGTVFTVVSSDRRIYGRARSAGLPALRIHEFNALLDTHRRRQAEGDDRRIELERKSRRLSPGELAEWLEIFDENS
jgi:hypothetical protein